jgi:hypothetical protein
MMLKVSEMEKLICDFGGTSVASPVTAVRIIRTTHNRETGSANSRSNDTARTTPPSRMTPQTNPRAARDI